MMLIVQLQTKLFMHLVEKFSINLRFLNSIQPNDINLTKMKYTSIFNMSYIIRLSAELPEFKVNISPKKYGQIMRLINTLTERDPSPAETVKLI